MKFRHLVSTAAAMSLMAVSSASFAQSAPLPSSEHVKGDSDLSTTTIFISVLALSAIVAGTTIALNSNDKPASP